MFRITETTVLAGQDGLTRLEGCVGNQRPMLAGIGLTAPFQFTDVETIVEDEDRLPSLAPLCRRRGKAALRVLFHLPFSLRVEKANFRHLHCPLEPAVTRHTCFDFLLTRLRDGFWNGSLAQ